MAAERPMTSPNSMMAQIQKAAWLVKIISTSVGLFATPYAVRPVTASASAIHTYTFLISTANAEFTTIGSFDVPVCA